MTSLPLRRPNALPDVATPEFNLLVDRVRAWYALSPEEAAVALGVWALCTDTEIAERLGWAPGEVEARLRRCCTVLRPLGLGTRTGVGEAVVRAMQGGGAVAGAAGARDGGVRGAGGEGAGGISEVVPSPGGDRAGGVGRLERG